MRLVDAEKVLNMEYGDAMTYLENGCDYDMDRVLGQFEEEPALIAGNGSNSGKPGFRLAVHKI